ncbi:hypothetical protein PVAP13_4KG076433 [Panicum virgatum]|uniref:Uncharacterized protein n=1 Tax=Panicum virgatum TaxID=38727 RepID=A0A8T0TMB8_PANVG|nr:hypothetical protein PVAP13_4KG076433 [Panicum virgatum]
MWHRRARGSQPPRAPPTPASPSAAGPARGRFSLRSPASPPPSDSSLTPSRRRRRHGRSFPAAPCRPRLDGPHPRRHGGLRLRKRPPRRRWATVREVVAHDAAPAPHPAPATRLGGTDAAAVPRPADRSGGARRRCGRGSACLAAAAHGTGRAVPNPQGIAAAACRRVTD